MTTCELTSTVIDHAIQVPSALEGKRVHAIIFVEDDAEIAAGNQGVRALAAAPWPVAPDFTPLTRDECQQR